MKRIMLDTSTYGMLIEESEVAVELAKLIPVQFVIYGAKIIRMELRDTPKTIKKGNKSKRILLLNIYDSLVGEHNLEYNKLVDTLANDYFIEYKSLGGALSNDSLRNDLIIVATATIYHLDIVISNDEKTMLCKNAISAYQKVNKKYGLENPAFLSYSKFKEKVIKEARQNEAY